MNSDRNRSDGFETVYASQQQYGFHDVQNYGGYQPPPQPPQNNNNNNNKKNNNNNNAVLIVVISVLVLILGVMGGFILSGRGNDEPDNTEVIAQEETGDTEISEEVVYENPEDEYAHFTQEVSTSGEMKTRIVIQSRTTIVSPATTKTASVEKAESLSITPIKGKINTHKKTVSGYTSDYVVYNKKMTTIRKSLGNGWHITAKNVCRNYDTTWYEVWDSDDGDYYGWVDEKYIDFNSDDVQVVSINTKGKMKKGYGVVSGYETSYVVNNKEKKVKYKSIPEGCNVTAKNACENYDRTWYEVWDTDKGTYYGWVDEKYIDFNAVDVQVVPINMKGQIKKGFGVISGYETSYVVNNKEQKVKYKGIPEGCNVTAKNACENYNRTWYEVWDTDKDTYYGWVDEKYIDMNGGEQTTTTTATTTVTTTTTVPPTEPPTEAPTEPPIPEKPSGGGFEYEGNWFEYREYDNGEWQFNEATREWTWRWYDGKDPTVQSSESVDEW